MADNCLYVAFHRHVSGGPKDGALNCRFAVTSAEIFWRGIFFLSVGLSPCIRYYIIAHAQLRASPYKKMLLPAQNV